MKKLFISSPLNEEVQIPRDLAHHLLQVLRHSKEEPVLVSGLDKRSGLYSIVNDDLNACKAKLIRFVEESVPEKEIVLVQSFLKGDKFEWVLQKATELNVSHVYGVSTKHSVAHYDKKKLDQKEVRWQKILKESSQQCGRAYLPELTVQMTWKEVLRQEAQRPDTALFIAYEREGNQSLKVALSQIPRDEIQRIVICIGPEGGFHSSEVDDLLALGGQSISLGKSILRAETAAISSVAILQYEYNIKGIE